MAQVYFDTLKFVETLEEAGLPANQARAISSAVKDSHEAVDVATRRDIDDVRKDMEIMRTELKADIDDIRKDMEIMRKDIIIKMGAMLVAAVSILAVIIKFPM